MRARALRSNPPELERRLWTLLRDLKPLGFRCDIERVMLNVLVGPLIGWMVVEGYFWLHWTLYSPSQLPYVATHFFWENFWGALRSSYVAGGVVALLNGIITSVIAHRTFSLPRRLVYSAISGGILCTALLTGIFLIGVDGMRLEVLFFALPGVSGASASLVCTALIERFGAPPQGDRFRRAGGLG